MTVDESSCRARPPGPGQRARAHVALRALRRSGSWRRAGGRFTMKTGPHGHREPAAVHQGRRRLGTAARRRRRRGARPHRPALRRGALPGLLQDKAEAPAPRAPPRPRRRYQHQRPARMLAGVGPLLASEDPAMVLVYGDTNSTLAGALAAAQAGVPGRTRRGRDALLRPHDARGAQPRAHRPRERLLLCSSEAPAAILRGERVGGEIEVVGDVMVDVAQLLGPRAAARTEALAAAGVEPGGYVLATAHRAGNVDDPARLERARGPTAGGAGAGGAADAPADRNRLAAAGLRSCSRRRRPARAAAGLPRLHRAAVQRPRGAHRLRRRAEGGVPRRRPRA